MKSELNGAFVLTTHVGAPPDQGVAATDIITQGGYDGDGKTDYCVWRPGSSGTFYMMTAGARIISTTTSEATGDYPVANYNAH